MANWEYEYRDLTFGGAQDIGIESVEGLETPMSKLDEIQRAKDHGSWDYADYLEARKITFTGDIVGTDATDFEGKVNELRAALLPAESALPLILNIPGDVVKRIYCKPIRRKLTTDRNYSNFYGKWAAEFIAGDPRIYADVESELIGAGTAENAGIFATPPVVVITGSSTNPKITNTTTGEFIEITTTVASGEDLVIDFANKTIYNDTDSAYAAMTATSTWWDLDPGDNVIAFTGGGTLVMNWRSSWV